MIRLLPFLLSLLVLHPIAGTAVKAAEAAPPKERPPIKPEELLAPTRPDPSILPLEVLLRRAESLLERTTRESTERAAEIYRHALQVFPDSAEAHTGQARTQVVWYGRRWSEDDSLLDRAVASARLAVELAGSDPRSHAALALALMARDDWKESFEVADRAWSLRGEGTPPWVDSAYTQSLLGRWELDRALEVIEGAVRRRADLAALHAMHGQVLIEQRRFDEALLPLQRAWMLEPDFAPAILRIAWARDNLGDHATAAHLYAKVSGNYPEEKPRAYLLASASLIGTGDFESALRGLEKIAIKATHGLSEGTRLYLMAHCHEKAGRFERARELYLQVIAQHPRASLGSFTAPGVAAASYEGLARMARAQERLPEAAGYLEEAMRLERPTIELFLSLSEVYAGHGLRDEALATLERGAGTDFGARLAGEKLEIHLARARLLQGGEGGGNREALYRPALEALERDRAMILATGNEAWLLDAARVCTLLDDQEGAIGWLEIAVGRGYHHLDWIRDDPEMGVLTGHPGFPRLVEAARRVTG